MVTPASGCSSVLPAALAALALSAACATGCTPARPAAAPLGDMTNAAPAAAPEGGAVEFYVSTELPPASSKPSHGTDRDEGAPAWRYEWRVVSDGGYGATDIMRVLRIDIEPPRACGQALKNRRHEAWGPATLAITIAAQGGQGVPALRADTHNDPTYIACMDRALRLIAWPKPRSGRAATVVVKWTIMPMPSLGGTESI